MAEEETSEETAPAGGKKKILIFIVVGLLLVGLSVGGTILALSFLKEDPVEEPLAEGETPAVAEEEVVKAPAIYYPIKPPIIVNFNTKGRQRFLQTEITLLTREGDVIPAIELHMPMIRNALVMLISGQNYEDLQTPEGKEFLRVQCLDKVRSLIEQEVGKPGIEQLLFTSFVMQ